MGRRILRHLGGSGSLRLVGTALNANNDLYRIGLLLFHQFPKPGRTNSPFFLISLDEKLP
jgi:hypothetical protein